jgi:nitrite reductase/ring-hydroxylating ferredoxin subunit
MDTYDFVFCLNESEIKDGQMKGLYLKGRPILLVKEGKQVYALSNRCPHMGCSLERGILKEHFVTCPCHEWKFDIRNGQYVKNSSFALTSYPCKIQNGQVYVELKEEE